MARESNSFSLLLRYQAQAERHYRRAIEEFDRLKALRNELPNEPIIEAQPEAQAEQTKPTSGVYQTDPSAPENPPASVAEASPYPVRNAAREVSTSRRSRGDAEEARRTSNTVKGKIQHKRVDKGGKRLPSPEKLAEERLETRAVTLSRSR
jgi:hypothetical protein